MKTKTVTNIANVTEMLAETVDAVRNGDATFDEGNTLANLAGKIIAAQRIRIEYARARKQMPSIEFMND